MRQERNSDASIVERLLGQLVVEKKKAVTTACLIIVMTIMWVRVLTRHTPEAAQAVSVAGQSSMEVASPKVVEVTFLELPTVAGRNDLITRDFFVADGWRHFTGGRRKSTGIEEVNVLAQNGSEEVIRKVAEKLRLEAIVLSKNPLTSINNRVLYVGDRTLIYDGKDKYECEVIAIEENTVKIKCREAEITLKLVQMPAAE